jgi:hypothetical protein
MDKPGRRGLLAAQAAGVVVELVTRMAAQEQQVIFSEQQARVEPRQVKMDQPDMERAAVWVYQLLPRKPAESVVLECLAEQVEAVQAQAREPLVARAETVEMEFLLPEAARVVATEIIQIQEPRVEAAVALQEQELLAEPQLVVQVRELPELAEQ